MFDPIAHPMPPLPLLQGGANPHPALAHFATAQELAAELLVAQQGQPQAPDGGPLADPNAEAEAAIDAPNPFLTQWRPRTLADALQPRPPAAWFVERLLRAGSLTMIFGAPGSLKSLLVLDMVAAVVAGSPWLPSPPGVAATQPAFATQRAPCLWIDYDNGEELTDERMAAVARAWALPADAPLRSYSLAVPWLNLTRADHARFLAELIEQSGARIVVMDNLSLVKGDAAENSDEMRPVMSHLRQVADGTRCAIVVIHHQRKMGAGQGSSGGEGSNRRGEGVRGWSGIEGAFDLILHAERPARGDTVILTPAKVRRAAPFERIGATFAAQSEGDVLQSARFWAQGVEEARPALDRVVRRAVLEQLGLHPLCNQSRLVEHVADHFAAAGSRKPGRDAIRGIIKQMALAGEIAEVPGSRAANRKELTYALP